MKSKSPFEFAFNQNAESKANRSRQSDVMSDIEILDVMMGSYQKYNSEVGEGNSENEKDSRLNRQEKEMNQNDKNSGLT